VLEHYAAKSGKTAEEVLKIWETDRTYWYMNYYQEDNQARTYFLKKSLIMTLGLAS